MKVLWTIIILDCILTIIFVGLLDVPEVNPLLGWMIPYIGVYGMLGVKLIYSYILLNMVAKRLAEKYNLSIDKYCYIVSVVFVCVWIKFL
jgi:hypothetical protein